MKKIFKYTLALALFLPILALAAPFNGIKDVLKSSIDLLNVMIRVIFALSIVYFFWGTSQFILHSDDQKSREDGRKKMIWGIVAIFVMVSIGGILVFIGGLVGIQPGTLPSTSTVPPVGTLPTGGTGLAP